VAYAIDYLLFHQIASQNKLEIYYYKYFYLWFCKDNKIEVVTNKLSHNFDKEAMAQITKSR